MTSRPSTESTISRRKSLRFRTTMNNGGLLRQQRTSDRQQSSRATFVPFGRATQSSPTPRLTRPKPGPFFPRDCARHRANSCLVIVIDRGGGKGMIEIRALKRDGSNQRNPLFPPSRAEAGTIRRGGGISRLPEARCDSRSWVGVGITRKPRERAGPPSREAHGIFHAIGSIGRIRA